MLAYADDIDIVGRTINYVKEACLALPKAASNMGLIINEEKTKFMQVTSKPIMISIMIWRTKIRSIPAVQIFRNNCQK